VGEVGGGEVSTPTGGDVGLSDTVVARTRGGVVYAVVSPLLGEDILVRMRGEESVRGSV